MSEMKQILDDTVKAVLYNYQQALFHYLKHEEQKESVLLTDCENRIIDTFDLLRKSKNFDSDDFESMSQFFAISIPFMLVRSLNEQYKLEFVQYYLLEEKIPKSREMLEIVWDCLEDVELKQKMKELLQ